ncbi:hypothetical protein ACQCSV_00890 [Pseudarthrobacter sp. S3]|uniref:hypothetical protein n=1 Tax=Pseudarthrobacter sp. S3 TaxID=3418419 RepID=UPI003CFB97AD
MKTLSRRGQVILGIAAVILLTALSLVAVGVVGNLVNPGGSGFLSRARCAAPNLPGPVVSVSLTNMGGPMMGRRNGMMGGAMRMTADRSTVAHGTVSFRYERAEKELFARVESVGHEIENRVTGNDSNRLKDQGLKAESTSAAGYGSAEHHEKFSESLANTGANETQIRGRLAAARSEGTHPSATVTMGKGRVQPRPGRAARGQQWARRGPKACLPAEKT